LNSERKSRRLILRPADQEIVLYKDDDMEALWQQLAEESECAENKDCDQEARDHDDALPYWAEVWPAAVFLAARIHDDLARYTTMAGGKPCLDLGCGLGLVTLQANMAGLFTIGMDYKFRALQLARKSAQANAMPETPWACTDWRRPAFKKGCSTLVFGADILYERRFIPVLTSFLDHTLGPQGRFVSADPTRNFTKDFTDAMNDGGFIVEGSIEGEVEHQGVPVEITLREFIRHNGS
jgi:2-polyprenyl-3-methyl-5-hydroxy-6-metoxy-1,4-benzoquinol methylase